MSFWGLLIIRIELISILSELIGMLIGRKPINLHRSINKIGYFNREARNKTFDSKDGHLGSCIPRGNKT